MYLFSIVTVVVAYLIIAYNEYQSVNKSFAIASQESIKSLKDIQATAIASIYLLEKHYATKNFLIDFTQAHPEYAQIRVISKEGYVLTRINRNKHQVETVSADKLQDKSDRYSIKELQKLKSGELYISPLDYNKEGMRTEYDKITFRIGKILSSGNFIVLNYNKDLISHHIRAKGLTDIKVNGPDTHFTFPFGSRQISKKITLQRSKQKSEKIKTAPWQLTLYKNTTKEKNHLQILLIVFSLLILSAFVVNYFYSKKMQHYLLELLLYRDFVDRSAIFSVTDKRGNILYANKLFEDISGYKNEELIGSSHRLIKSEYHDKAFFEKMWTTIAAGETWTGRIKNIAKNGTPYWVESIIGPVYNNKGEISKYASIRYDVTELALLEQEIKNKESQLLKSQYERLEAKKKMLQIGEFSSGLIHDLNNFIQAIDLNLNIADKQLPFIASDDKKNTERITSSLECIKTANSRMLELSQRYRKLLTRGKEDNVISLSLMELSNEVKMYFNHKLNSNSIELEINCEKDIIVKTEEIMLLQSILNIVSNAIYEIVEKKYQEKWIKISTKALEDTALILITDSGNGIPVDVVEKVFQAGFTTKKGNDGTGVGLSLVKTKLEHFGGTLRYDPSFPNTTFAIEIPYEYNRENNTNS